MVGLEELKNYLRVDFEDDDQLILTFRDNIIEVCKDIINNDNQEIYKSAIFWGVGQLYDNRNTTPKDLIPMLKSILYSKRNITF